MQKLNTPSHRSTGHGAALLAALSRITKAAPLTKVHDTEPAPRLRPLFGGLYESMFTATTAANVAKTAAPKPVPSLGTKQTPADTSAVRQHSVQSMVADPDFNADDPRHVHAAQLRATAGQHADLLASIKAVHAAGPNLNHSRGPVAI